MTNRYFNNTIDLLPFTRARSADVESNFSAVSTGLDTVQTEMDTKAPAASPTFTGTVTLPSTTSIGSVGSSEIAYLDGVTSAIQTQLDAKAPSASPTFTGTVGLPSTTSIGSVSSAELGYLDGVTTPIQTQLDAKALATGGTITNPTIVGGTISGASIDGTAQVRLQTFSGTGAQTVFTLAYAPYSENNTQIYVSGVYQEKDTYTVSGTTLTFSEAPVAGTDNIEVTSLSVTDLGATTSDMVSYLPAGSGAVATNVQAKLREVEKKIPPNSYTKKIVVFGSSVALGVGATNNQGWAYKLSQALASRGFTYSNVSIGGNTTQNLIDRFYTDVAPEDPDLVIIGLSLGNEGLAESGDKEATYNTYVRNMRKLVNMCRQQGYKVIVTGVYSRGNYTLTDYQYIRQADQELENSDIPYINFLGAVDDGTGKWRAGMFSDALHPNDVGHEAMFRAFPLSMFDNLLSPSTYIPDTESYYTLVMGDTIGTVPLQYVAESVFGSFTVSCKVRRKSGFPAGKPILSLENSGGTSTPIRIRNNVDEWALTNQGDDNIIATAIRSTNYERAALTVTYDYHSGILKLYVDGVLAGSANYTIPYNVDRVVFAGRSDGAGSFTLEGYEYSDFAVWRVALSAEQVYEAAHERISKASLALWSPVVDSGVQNGTRLVNLAPSDTFIRVGSAAVTAVPTDKLPGDPVISILTGRGFVHPADNVTSSPLRWINPTPSTGSLTMMAEIRKPAAAGLGKAILSFGNAGAHLYRARVFTTGEVEIADAANNVLYAAGINFTDGLPRHFALVYDTDGTTGFLRFYVDGEFRGSATVGALTHDRYAFGSRTDTTNVNAELYEFRNLAIYYAAISENQIRQAARERKFLTTNLRILSPGYEASYAQNSYLENAVGQTERIQWVGAPAMTSIV